MTETLLISPSRLVMRDGAGYDVLDSEARSVSLIHEEAITWAGSFSFPNFVYGTRIYDYSSGGTGGGPPFQERCTTYVNLIGQDWGPAESSPYTLADEVLGEVPAGTDFLDVQQLLTWTPPEQIFTLDVVPLTADGTQTSAVGGSIPCEFWGPIRRLAEVVLVGTEVRLRRYQSVAAGNHRIKQIETKYNGSVFYLPPDPPFPHTVFWQYGAGNASPCSSSGSIALGSSWTGTLTITPARLTA